MKPVSGGLLVGNSDEFACEKSGIDAASAAFLREGGFGGQPTVSGVVVNTATALRASAVLACVGMLAEDTAKIIPYLYRRKGNGEEERLSPKEHPVAQLLLRPTGRLKEGGWLTWMDFCTQMTAFYLLRGNAYAIIVEDERGVPIRLVPVNPDQITLLEAPDGSLWWSFYPKGMHEQALIGHAGLYIPYEKVLHLRAGISGNGLFGISKVEFGANAIGLALAQEEVSGRWMGTGGKLSGVLRTAEKIGETELKHIATMWAQVNAGLRNTGKVAILEKGLEFQPISMSSVDMEFIAARTLQIEEIGRLFRMPRFMLGLTGDGKATSEQQAQDYINYTLSTVTRVWAARLNFMFDLDEEGLEVGFDYSVLLRANTKARYDTYRLGIMGAFLTPDEARAAEGLPPKPGGDKLLFPSSTQPHGSAASGTAPDGAGHPDGQPNSDQPNAN